MLVRASGDEKYKEELSEQIKNNETWNSIVGLANSQLGVSKPTDNNYFNPTYINSVKQGLVKKYTAKEHLEAMKYVQKIVPQYEGVLKEIEKEEEKISAVEDLEDLKKLPEKDPLKAKLLLFLMLERGRENAKYAEELKNKWKEFTDIGNQLRIELPKDAKNADKAFQRPFTLKVEEELRKNYSAEDLRNASKALQEEKMEEDMARILGRVVRAKEKEEEKAAKPSFWARFADVGKVFLNAIAQIATATLSMFAFGGAFWVLASVFKLSAMAGLLAVIGGLLGYFIGFFAYDKFDPLKMKGGETAGKKEEKKEEKKEQPQTPKEEEKEGQPPTPPPTQ